MRNEAQCFLPTLPRYQRLQDNCGFKIRISHRDKLSVAVLTGLELLFTSSRDAIK